MDILVTARPVSCIRRKVSMFRRKKTDREERLARFWQHEAYQLEETKQELERLYLQL